MGYYSSIDGEIRFLPPIFGKQLREAEAQLAERGDCLFRFVIITSVEDNDVGTLVVRSSESIVPRWTEEVKAYTTREDLEAFVNILGTRSYEGEFFITGSDDGDLARWLLRDGEVLELRPEIVWPDGKRGANPPWGDANVQ